MNRILISILFAALAPVPALAGPDEEIAGTWECRQPGVAYGRKPPILYFGATAPKAGSQPVVVDVDGFARASYGLADMTPAENGWWKVVPPQGESLLVRPEGSRGKGPAAMSVRRGEAGATYRCLRIQSRA
jgi:hypothetical protein